MCIVLNNGIMLIYIVQHITFSYFKISVLTRESIITCINKRKVNTNAQLLFPISPVYLVLTLPMRVPKVTYLNYNAYFTKLSIFYHLICELFASLGCGLVVIMSLVLDALASTQWVFNMQLKAITQMKEHIDEEINAIFFI